MFLKSIKTIFSKNKSTEEIEELSEKQKRYLIKKRIKKLNNKFDFSTVYLNNGKIGIQNDSNDCYMISVI